MSLSNLLTATSGAISSLRESLNELGGSIITVVYSLDLIPAERAHGWGDSYYYALLSAVPNLFWDVHPSIAHGYLGQWLIEVVAPETAKRSGGLGYSLLAEAYYNFGVPGALIVFACIGWYLGQFSAWVHARQSAYRLALAAIVINIAAFASRGESHTCVRRLLFLYLVPYCLCSLLVHRRSITEIILNKNPSSFTAPRHE